MLPAKSPKYLSLANPPMLKKTTNDSDFIGRQVSSWNLRSSKTLPQPTFGASSPMPFVICWPSSNCFTYLYTHNIHLSLPPLTLKNPRPSFRTIRAHHSSVGLFLIPSPSLGRWDLSPQTTWLYSCSDVCSHECNWLTHLTSYLQFS